MIFSLVLEIPDEWRKKTAWICTEWVHSTSVYPLSNYSQPRHAQTYVRNFFYRISVNYVKPNDIQTCYINWVYIAKTIKSSNSYILYIYFFLRMSAAYYKNIYFTQTSCQMFEHAWTRHVWMYTSCTRTNYKKRSSSLHTTTYKYKKCDAIIMRNVSWALSSLLVLSFGVTLSLVLEIGV